MLDYKIRLKFAFIAKCSEYARITFDHNNIITSLYVCVCVQVCLLVCLFTIAKFI